MNADRAPDSLPLRGVLADIARVAGREAAIELARRLGGTRVNFASDPGPNHLVSRIVGVEAARAIGEELTAGIASIEIDLPIGPFGHQEGPRAKVDRMIEEGASERDIALAARYTTRGVRKRRQILRDRRQLDFFRS